MAETETNQAEPAADETAWRELLPTDDIPLDDSEPAELEAAADRLLADASPTSETLESTLASDGFIEEVHPTALAVTAGESLPDMAASDTEAITKVRCPNCKAQACWRGPLTEAMLQRSYTRGVNAESGYPNCPYCGTAMALVDERPAQEAIMTAAEQLDAERAGEAARPMYRQTFIPGTLPPFNFRESALRIEYLEREVQTAEESWEKAKKVASERKSEFDDAVHAMRKEIQDQRAARQAAESEQVRREDRAAAGLPIEEPTLGACSFEQKTGEPCPVCRGPHNENVPQRESTMHLAAAAASGAIAKSLTTEALVSCP